MQTNNIALADLRIGNYVLWSNTVCPIKLIDSLDNTVMLKSTMNGQTYEEFLNNIFGIPLTEEWLIKIGYHNIDGIFIHKKRFPYCIETFNGVFVLKNGNGDYIKPVVYIHSLQNLWYFLTGTELTLK